MKQYRVTRPDVYPPGSIGANDIRAREGHYAEALDARAASLQVRERLGLDEFETLDVQECEHGEVSATFTSV